MKTNDTPQSVLVLLHAGFALNALGAVLDMLFIANWLSGRTMYRWTLASVVGGPVSAFNGVAMDTVPLSEATTERRDIVFVIASFDPTGLANAPGVAPYLRVADRHGARLVGVETGGIALAKAGLLEGRAAAVHWVNREGFAELFPDITLTDAPVAMNGRLFTCVGGAAIPELTLSLIKEDAGREGARAVAEQLAARLDGDGPDRGAVHVPFVANAARLMAANLDAPISCRDLAARVGVTRRTLERRFFAQTGRTPGAYYLDLRLTRAQNLLQQTGLSVSEVAVETGFESLPAFSRAYRQRFGLPPSKDREQTLSASAPLHPCN